MGLQVVFGLKPEPGHISYFKCKDNIEISLKLKLTGRLRKVISYVSRGVTFHSLLVTRCKLTRGLLQKSLVLKNHSLLVAKFARYS